MKIILDTEVCKREGKDADLMLYLISLLSGCKITANTFEKARQQRLLKFDRPYDSKSQFPDYVSLNDTGEHVAESIMADSNVSEESGDRYTVLADKLREIFPAGKKPGYAYTWRDSTSCIADRLKKFFLKYGEHTDEQVIQATKEYVASFNGNYQYMQLLKYFIWKNKVTGEEVVRGRIVGEVERQSQLAAWIEDSEDKAVNNDWDVILR
jgi:hypothetical protein